ncbi:MAG TPA: DUF6516 family protein [Candidatus Tectomicrobia bacterium]|jgi:hypothetical protein
MPFTDYIATLQELLAATPFVTGTPLSYEERPPSVGLIKGWLVFVDGAQLDFKEFLLTRPTLRVIKYGYQYRAGHRLIFRYDNANDPAARHLPTFPHHKHTPQGFVQPNNQRSPRCFKKSCHNWHYHKTAAVGILAHAEVKSDLLTWIQRLGARYENVPVIAC